MRMFIIAVMIVLLFTGCVQPEKGPAPGDGTTEPQTTPTFVSEETEGDTDITEQTETLPPEQPSTENTEGNSVPTETEPNGSEHSKTQEGDNGPKDAASTEPEPTEQVGVNITDFKGIWLSQFDLYDIYTSGGTQRDEADFTARMARVLDNVSSLGFNTVLLQVRPNGDSMYPSEYYPMSKYVVGQYGRNADYDPVAVTVALAKERGLSIHAWINPMRCMTTAELEQVDDAYLIRRWYDDPEYNGTYIVQHGTYWYLNPAYEEVRELIRNGAAELLQKYDFDGLHMDDYFYPTTDAAFDAAAYAVCGEGMELDAFRRENLNILVSGLYEVTKAHGAEKLYGISPAGNIITVYDAHYADVYTWCSEEGYIDYICPQVYFGLEHQNFDFVSVCNTWQRIIKTDAVDLIIGMSFEKALTREDKYAGSGKNEWKEHQDVLKRCLEYTGELTGCRGISVFSYQHFFSPSTGKEVAGTAAERENFIPVLKEITWQD